MRSKGEWRQENGGRGTDVGVGLHWGVWCPVAVSMSKWCQMSLEAEKYAE